jgi:hypothetical protein
MPPRPAPPRWPFLAALVFAGLQLAVFFPGYVSFDVLSQLEQARSGVINDVSPPAALLCRLGEQLVAGTGAVFVLGTLLFWGGCALLWRARRLSPAAALVAALLGLPLGLLLPHLWTDLHLLAVLALYCGVVAGLGQREGLSRGLLWLLALGLLGWATWVRHNAILAVLPLAWLLVPQPAALAGRLEPRRLPRLALWGMLAVLLVALRSFSGVAVDQRVSVWAVTPLWDLQALSVAGERLRFPDGFTGAGISVAELRGVYSENTAVPLFETPSGIRNPTLELFTAEPATALLNAWWRGVLEQPLDWLQHRWRVFGRLFGPHTEGDLVHMVDSPRFAPDAPRAAWQEALHTPWRAVVERYKALGGASAGVFLLAALAVFALGRRGQGAPDPLAGCLVLSALLYVAALFPLTPSAELRYLAWPLWACAVAAVVAWAPRRH